MAYEKIVAEANKYLELNSLQYVENLPHHLTFTQKVKRTIKQYDETNLFKSKAFNPNVRDLVKSKAALDQASLDLLKNELEKAMLNCNMSICLAPQNSSILAMAYAKRAEICLKMNEFEDCLKNIDLAEKYGFKHLNDSIKPNCIEMQQKYKKPETKVCSNLKLSFRQHKTLPSFAYCLEYVPDRGIRTIKELKPGDIVAAEMPFIWKPANSNVCDYVDCGKTSFATISCKKCASSLYCSEMCRQKAFDSYHKYECDTKLLGEIGLRWLIKAIKEFDCEALLKLIKKEKEFKPSEMDFSSKNYDLSMLKCILQMNDFYIEGLPKDVSYMERFFAVRVTKVAYLMSKMRNLLEKKEWNLLMKLFALIRFKNPWKNTGPSEYKLTYNEENKSVTSKLVSKPCNFSIHGLLSLFAVSCKPNICMTMDRSRKVFAKVIRPIPKGSYLLADSK